MAKKIPLTQGKWAVVDDADYQAVVRKRWYAIWDPKGRTFRAARDTSRRTGKRRVLMAREILGLEYGDNRLADHENHDTLDNRRFNLRVVTARGNQANRVDQSQYGPGIRLAKGGRYHARVCFGGTEKFIGAYDTLSGARGARTKFLKRNGIA